VLGHADAVMLILAQARPYGYGPADDDVCLREGVSGVGSAVDLHFWARDDVRSSAERSPAGGSRTDAGPSAIRASTGERRGNRLVGDDLVEGTSSVWPLA
jgi:hypothetical protein